MAKYRMRAHRVLLPLAAFLAILPLLLHGPSCGHDFDFHLLNWIEAAHQIGQAQYPRWAFTPAFHAGEPRFLFYPPLSWMTGAALTALLPFRFVPAAYTFLCLTLSGFSFHRLARLWATESAAVLAAILYLLNPYSLFTAYERTAYAELLAAALIPLLFAAILRQRPSVAGIAVPLALLWLTNAPAAVMSTYALALLALIRLCGPLIAPLAHAMSEFTREASAGNLAATTAAGTALGLALPAYYLLPAAFERRWVEIGMAILEGLRPADNFLFHHTPDEAHDAVLHTASLIAVLLLMVAFAALGAAWTRRREQREAYLLPCLTGLVAAIAFLLTPWSAFVWNHAPELAFLQFPWRTCALLACAAALAVALVLHRLALRPGVLALLSGGLASVLIFYPSPGTFTNPEAGQSWPTRLSTPQFTQGCEPGEAPQGREQWTQAAAETGPTDEYTPEGADNDALHRGDPPFWVIAGGGSADIDSAAPPKLTAGGAPDHLTLALPQPSTLVMNRRAYPAWRILVNGKAVSPAEPERGDGLIAIALPAGSSTVDLRFVQTPDRTVGDAVSLVAFLVLLLVRKKPPNLLIAKSR